MPSPLLLLLLAAAVGGGRPAASAFVLARPPRPNHRLRSPLPTPRAHPARTPGRRRRAATAATSGGDDGDDPATFVEDPDGVPLFDANDRATLFGLEPKAELDPLDNGLLFTGPIILLVSAYLTLSLFFADDVPPLEF